MKRETVTSARNPLLVHLKKLLAARSYREACGEFAADGTKLLEEAARWVPGLHTVIAADDVEICRLPEEVRVVRVPRDVMASVSQMDAPQGAIFLCRTPQPPQTEILPGTLLLDGIQDPGNLGTVIRTADACGADAVFLSKGSVDLYNPKVLRATMGSLFHVPVFQNIDLHALSEKMQAKQIPLYAAHLKGDRYPYALPLQDACAFLIGNEARGLSEDAAALCDAWVKIPMPGQAESLNASVAAGVLLYEVVRQRLPK